jgi:hypothetical protein
MNPETSHPNSIPVLLRELRDETTTLLRQEVGLAKAEMSEKFSRLGTHASQIAVGGFIAYAGVILLLIGIGQLVSAIFVRAGLDAQVAVWLGPTLVGLLVAIIGWAMYARAKHAFAHDNFKPTKTIESLRENKQWAQDKLNHSP